MYTIPKTSSKVIMIVCPKCNQVDYIIKSGILRGAQRYTCKACQFSFVNRATAARAQDKKKHPTTIVDIAKQLGIASSTVSRALHGHPDVNEKTRDLIIKTATALRYQPNRLAYNLVKNKTNLVGMIVPEFENQFFPDVIRGAQEVLSEAGYNLMIMQSNESYSVEVANATILRDSQVGGLLCSITQETNNFAHLESFVERDIPLVLFNRVIPTMQVPKVVVDDFEGAFRIVEHLIQEGYRRIAHLGGPIHLLVSQERLRGYVAALQKYDLPVEDELIVHSDLSMVSSRVYGNYFLDRANRPEAIFALNDPMAIELILLAKESGIRIPEELGIAGFSNDRVSRYIDPALTTMAQPTYEMGRVAAQQLLDLMQHSLENVSKQTVLKTSLVVRKSSLKGVG